MNTFGNTKNNGGNSRSGILGLFEDDSERETSFTSTAISTVAEGGTRVATGVFEAAISLVQNITNTEQKTESCGNGKIPLGSINFKENQAQAEQLQKQQAQFEELQKQKAETDRKKVFFQALKEDRDRVQKAEDKLFEEEINDIITNLPTEQKNKLLHYQASYKDRSIYQRAELRKKLIEEQKKSENQQKAASIPSPAKQPSAMEGAFEGRSGSQGGGTANLSAQAVG